MKWKSLVCGAVLSVAIAAPAQAAPVGIFTISDVASGVTVGLTFIDWEPAGGGTGTFEVGGGTTLTSDAGDLQAGDIGTVKDLDAGTSLPLDDFFTFAAYPGLTFTLTSLGPGAENSDCSTVDSNGESCSPFEGSVFVLTYLNGNTFVSLAGEGTATDGNGLSFWEGGWSTQLSTMSPLEVQQFFGCTPEVGIEGCTNFEGSIFSTYSGEFNVEIIPVPEPTMLALLGLGLLGTGYRARRRRQ